MIKRLFAPVDISVLVFIRIAFGILAFADVLSTWGYKHLYKNSFDPDRFSFAYYGFEWVKPLPEPFMSLLMLGTMFAALCIVFGKWYRPSCFIYFIGFSYIFLIEKSYYLNHAYLFIVISAVMIFLPANRSFSIDVWKTPSFRRDRVPFFCIGILIFLMSVVYFYGGIAKINQDWLNAFPLKIWLKGKSDMFLIGPLLGKEWFAYLLSYGGLLLDLFVVFFLLWKRTRIIAFSFVLFFHITNLILFSIGIFPYLSTVLSSLFFPSDYPKKIIAWLTKKIKWIAKIDDKWRKRFQDYPKDKVVTYGDGEKKLFLGGLGILCFLMLTIPFRHHFYQGNVAWTEEGHRYSWRMMLRSKVGKGYFNIKFPDQSRMQKVDGRHSLTKRQRRKMLTHPDMILQYAHFLRDSLAEVGHPDIEIYANIQVRLNNRKYQQYIDEKVDLAKVEWEMFGHSEWIVPLDEKLEPKPVKYD